MNIRSSITDSSPPVTRHSSRLLIVGCNGMLAQAIASSAPSGYAITAVDLPEFNITDQAMVQSVVEATQPEIIINCAAYTNVDGCETEQELANQVNGIAVGYLAEAAKRVNATLVHISTDYVFDGEKKTPYAEEDQTNPQSVYGSSKLLGEQAILSSGLEKYFIIRTSWLYGPGGNNFVETILRLAGEREELRIISDQVGSPTYTGDLADAVFALLGKCCDQEAVMKKALQIGRDEDVVTGPSSPVTDLASRDSSIYGSYHFSNGGQCSWYDFAVEIVDQARKNGVLLKLGKILPINTEDYPLPAERPKYSVFSKEKYCRITKRSVPGWQDSLAQYLENRVNTQ